MTSKEKVLDIMRRTGKIIAEVVQAESPEMSGTELNDNELYIPSFTAAIAKMNMLERHAGTTDGFVCKSSAGRVVRLLQNYDSTIYTAEPEELSAQWGFVWSDDPKHAKPFIALSTSPYMIGNCCTENDVIYRSKIDNNVHAPSSYPDGWEVVTID